MHSTPHHARERPVDFLKRLIRSLAQAGKEIALALCFLVGCLIVIIVLERFGVSSNLFTLEVKITMNAWDWEADRQARAEQALAGMLPERSRYRVHEIEPPPGSEFQQTLIAEIEIRQISAQFTAIDVFFDLNQAVIGPRGASSSEIVQSEGPGPLWGAFMTHLILLPWLVIRLGFLAPDSPPARPLLPAGLNRGQVVGRCLIAGIALGVLIPMCFTGAERLGLLHFSGHMPSLESLGVSPGLLVPAALLIALAGAAEEAFFRGLLLRRFVRNGLPMLGVVICAFWFTLLHFPYFSWDSGNLVYALWIALAGLGFGFMTIRLGSWVPAAILHAAYNFTVTLIAGLLGTAA